ncbi:hypothetical protein ACE4RR_00715 [Alteribacillus sp. HJP-4]
MDAIPPDGDHGIFLRIRKLELVDFIPAGGRFPVGGGAVRLERASILITNLL